MVGTAYRPGSPPFFTSLSRFGGGFFALFALFAFGMRMAICARLILRCELGIPLDGGSEHLADLAGEDEGHLVAQFFRQILQEILLVFLG